MSNIFNLLSFLAKDISLYGLCINIAPEKEESQICIKIKNLLIGNDEFTGIKMDNLKLSVKNFIEEEDLVESFKKASFVFEKFSFQISEDWANKAINSDKSIKKFGISDLSLSFAPEKMSLYFTYNKIPTSIDFKISIRKGKLVIDLDRFWLGDMIPMPKIFQSSIMNFAQKYMTPKKMLIDGVRFSDRFILIDHQAMIPVDCYLDFQNIYVEKNCLILQGGINLEDGVKKTQ